MDIKLSTLPLIRAGFYTTFLDLPGEEMISWLKAEEGESLKPDVDDWGGTNAEDIRVPHDEKAFEDLFKVLDGVMEMIDPLLYREGDFWGQIKGKGGNTAYHTHGRETVSPNFYDLSFVYYLQGEPENGRLAFPIEAHRVVCWKEFEVKSNLLIVFPSVLPHFARMNTVDRERIILSGNYFHPNPQDDTILLEIT